MATRNPVISDRSFSAIRDRPVASSEGLSVAMSSWERPSNAQSATQWVYVATIARGTVEALGVDPADAHAAVTKRFEVSGLEALFSLAGSDSTPTP